MAHRRWIEVLVGLFMAVGLVALFFLSMKVGNLPLSSGESGYRITARFDDIGGLKARARVSMAGVPVGRVEAIELDRETYEAVVTLYIERQFDTIPNDSFASIFTAGLLGEKYVGLEPGGAEEFLRDGDRIGQTQSALVLERIVGQFLFSTAEESSE
ncbi:MAG: outer membrane lipid asymmetry maintenance protein MlaD [Chromatiaceae bacterium]|jgi:phospholipid/cholesterol/gamma-HCH transport system substrate-binding protein|nr:outer membrane lipid asymmetry maintenance protein MlaD [Chromatiaceae bacterium]